jgi:Aspartyl protease
MQRIIFYLCRAEQVIGREGETATFLKRCVVSFGLHVIGFAPPAYEVTSSNNSKGKALMHRLHQLVVVVAFASLLLTGGMNQAVRAQKADHGEVAIPFTLTDHNNIVVSVVLNGTDTLNLMLHTAARDVTLTEEAVRKSKSIKFTDTAKVKSWGGEADSRFSQGNQVQIGELWRNNIDIWEDINSGKDTDGKFGLDFFQNRIVEIDFDQRRIALHDKLPRKVKKYERLKLENQDGQLLVQGSCLIEGKTYTNKFLLHSGYSGGILLDDAFAATAGVDGKIRITDESSLKDSFGNTIKVKKGILPVFILGSSRVSNTPAGFFAGAIGAQKMSIIGCEILKQFNLIFDIANNDLYIAPRHA